MKLEMIEILVNGTERNVDSGWNLADLVEDLNLPPGPIAVEVNGGIVRKADWSSVLLKAADQVEIVHFVGGG